MDAAAAKFSSHREAEDGDLAHYRSLSGAERLAILLQLVDPSQDEMALKKDLKDFLKLLNLHGVDYVIVGAYALAFHGRPRYTGDLDILVRPSAENARKLDGVIQGVRVCLFRSTNC